MLKRIRDRKETWVYKTFWTKDDVRCLQSALAKWLRGLVKGAIPKMYTRWQQKREYLLAVSTQMLLQRCTLAVCISVERGPTLKVEGPLTSVLGHIHVGKIIYSPVTWAQFWVLWQDRGPSLKTIVVPVKPALGLDSLVKVPPERIVDPVTWALDLVTMGRSPTWESSGAVGPATYALDLHCVHMRHSEVGMI